MGHSVCGREKMRGKVNGEKESVKEAGRPDFTQVVCVLCCVYCTCVCVSHV